MNVHFVCLGNTYRSRLAEAYVNSKKIPHIHATSSGVWADEDKNGAIAPNTKKVLMEENFLAYTAPTWQQTTKTLLEKSDLVIFMDNEPFIFCRDKFDFIPKDYRIWDIHDIHGDLGSEEKVQESREAFKKIKNEADSCLADLGDLQSQLKNI